MHITRRLLLKNAGATGAVGLAITLGLIRPTKVLAAWAEGDFKAEGLDALLSRVGAHNATMDARIEIDVPELASNGSVVPVTVQSAIPGTQSIAIIADNNPLPLIGAFDFANDAQGFVATRIKMLGTSNVRAVVKAGDKYYMNERLVNVTIGGCGG